MKKKVYQSYIRNLWPLPFVEPWLYGPTKLAKKPFKFTFILCTRLGSESGWHYYADELAKLGRDIDAYLAIPEHLDKFKVEAERARSENYLFAQEMDACDVESMGLEQLAELLKRWYSTYSKFTSAYMPVDATDEALELDIRSALKGAGIELSLQEYACLLTPGAESYVQKEHRDFCVLLRQCSAKPRSVDCQRAGKQYVKEWWWSSMGWGQHEPITFKDVTEKLSRIRDPEKVLEKQRTEELKRDELLKEKRRIVDKLPENVLNMLDAFELLAEMHDVRKEIQIRMMKAGFAITEAILRKTVIPLEYRDYMLVQEYLGLTEGNRVALDLLESRRQAFWCEVNGKGDIKIFSGREAMDKLAQSGIYKRKRKEERSIRGVPASPGSARGECRVGLEPRKLVRDFKKGEVLVAGMTTPDYVPAMKKAVAIVTDEGGITCHAAIISRELHKPCIIGAKNATQVLKDGDMVEVDALPQGQGKRDKGVVRRIN